MFKTDTPEQVLITLLPLLIGMALATVYDVSMNLRGTIFAVFAVLFTSCAQIFTSKYQKELEVNLELSLPPITVHLHLLFSSAMLCSCWSIHLR